MSKRVMITGANVGLGKEAARQFALQSGIEKVYLACRNSKKANIAKRDLEQTTGKTIFEIVELDVSDLESVRRAVAALSAPIDALIMNAGGGSKNFNDPTEYGVTQIFAQNVLGHAVLLQDLIAQKKLTEVAAYVGSEASRGIKQMRIPAPDLADHSIEDLQSIADGSYFVSGSNPMVQYRFVKYVATLWMSAMARHHRTIRFVTVSPGNTSGTAVFDSMPRPVAWFIKNVLNRVYRLFGMVHGVEAGAARYVQAVLQPRYESGGFYASKQDRVTGEIVDQASFAPQFANETFQNNAFEALQRILSSKSIGA